MEQSHFHLKSSLGIGVVPEPIIQCFVHAGIAILIMIITRIRDSSWSGLVGEGVEMKGMSKRFSMVMAFFRGHNTVS
jgi:hypothetical protein